MSNKKCLIVLSKNSINITNNDYDLVIGVESGCLSLIENNIKPDISISDFDHVSKSELKLIRNNSKKFIHLNSEKDILDGEAAIKIAIENNISDITCIFEINNRVDLLMSIIYLANKYNVKFLSDSSIIFKIQGEFVLEKKLFSKYKYISLFPLEDDIITIDGLKYNCKQLCIEKFSTQTFSNSFSKNEIANIWTKKNVIIIFTND